ncbi:VanZ family protein [Chitinophagaceae bacterium MMS25-I14]
MWQIFTESSPYKKRARLLAILWTLLIFILCFLPENDIPQVNVPLADKWVHFILFGVFSLLWLCARPSVRPSFLLFIFFISVFTGWLVEELQGLLAFLGRSKDIMDILADAVGGLLGVIAFLVLYTIAAGKKR